MIFINYRRDDTGDVVAPLAENLERTFGDAVYYDLKSLKGGEVWSAALEQAVNDCDVMLAVIGPDWQRAPFAEGPRRYFPRLSDPEDPVRRELEIALKSPKPKIIPVLMKNAKMPPTDWLATVGLERLSERNAVSIDTNNYERDVKKLVSFVQKLAPQLIWRRDSKAGGSDDQVPKAISTSWTRDRSAVTVQVEREHPRGRDIRRWLIQEFGDQPDGRWLVMRSNYLLTVPKLERRFGQGCCPSLPEEAQGDDRG